MKLFSHNTARKLFKYQRDSARSERDSARIERDSARSECNVLRQDVARMEKNESLRENFVTTLTHDLRNPVATIKMAIEVLKTDPMGEHFDAIMKLIDQNADQAEELISHLLDANLIKSGIKLPLNKSHCEILSVLKKCVLSVSKYNQNRIVLENLDSKKLWGYWDSHALQRAFGNLLSNALKFSKENSFIKILVSQDTQVTSVSFQNFGEIISLDDQIKIFDSHYRSTNSINQNVKGWGLGLTLVKGISESHGGKVEVTSNERDGTHFIVRLPNKSINN